MEGKKLKKRETRLDASNEKCNNLTYSINLHLKNMKPKRTPRISNLRKIKESIFSLLRNDEFQHQLLRARHRTAAFPCFPKIPRFSRHLQSINRSNPEPIKSRLLQDSSLPFRHHSHAHFSASAFHAPNPNTSKPTTQSPQNFVFPAPFPPMPPRKLENGSPTKQIACLRSRWQRF